VIELLRGNQRKAAIGKSLVQKRLILDEPTRVVDV
jgi:ABC-type sugar transport system ATPase subunit